MSVPINIQGITINFPASGDSPNWAPAVIQFAQAVSNALNFTIGPADVPPQSYVMVSNANTTVSLPNLAFSTIQVRGAIISYAVYRNTSSATVTETGTLLINYNPTNPTGNKWELVTQRAGDAQITFNITDVGQIQFSTPLLAGTSFNGIITYQARAILQS